MPAGGVPPAPVIRSDPGSFHRRPRLWHCEFNHNLWRERIFRGQNSRRIVVDSRRSESVKGWGFQHTCLWLSLPGAVMALALALITAATDQSQAQSNTPSCSDAPPTLKRGAQPAPPPCPDPAAEDEPSRSLTPSEALIERARAAAFQFSKKLPNFICQEFMSRFTQRGREEKRLLDLVSAEIIYEDGQETYRKVKLNNSPTEKPLQEIDGSWSTGEFASILVDLLHPRTHAQFRSGGAATISGLSAQVYDFQVQRENSQWMLHADSQNVTAAYQGSVWIDPNTARVLRIEMQARNLPSDFPMDQVETAVDYSYVRIGETSVLLPVHAETLGCERGTSYCSHNFIDFRNYHEFKSETKILSP